MSVFGVPPTDVSNESDFSYMELLLTPHRKSLKDETVDRKMMLLMNPELWSPCPELEGQPMWSQLKFQAGIVQRPPATAGKEKCDAHESDTSSSSDDDNN